MHTIIRSGFAESRYQLNVTTKMIKTAKKRILVTRF